MSETVTIEKYLSGKLDGEERVVLEARLLIDTQLQERLKYQQQTYALINTYGRQCLKHEIETVHQRLFSERKYTRFQTTINNLFKRKL